ncbi:MAG: hypothetical protein JWP80_1509 [Pseudomonas sp.]|nr:hypothetical protein [Pseudomonas sp.]
MQMSPTPDGRKPKPGARTRAVVTIYLAGIMNINGFKRGVLISAIALGMGLSLPADAGGGGGWHGGGGGGWHGGGGGWHGGGGGWHGGSWHSDAWWGLGIGLVGGYAAATIANSYYYPSYPAYSYYYPAPAYYYPAYGYSGYAYAPAAYAPAPQVDPNYAQPAPVQTATVPPPAANWYYCASAKGYYPNVPRCPEPWQRVPSTPPGQIR